jgi:hypothetical protein
MAAKKKAPAKKAPAKKAPAKTPSRGEEGADTTNHQYFIRGKEAYVRMPSGDVFGPYSLSSAAGRTALRSEASGAMYRFGQFLRGGGGPLNRGK